MKNLFGKIALLVTVIAAGYMLLTAFGGTKTFWGWDAAQTGWGWKIFMIVILLATAHVFYYITKKGISFKAAHGALIVLLLGIGFGASTGFKFTAGDIKQRITYLNTYGQVTDTTILFKYYEDFYHFNDNPELKKYVIKYRELPGRNCWNEHILAYLRGDTTETYKGAKPSNAPSADSCAFKWHTGAYEMDLKVKLR